MCGVTTNVITACEVSNAGDSPTLPKLLAATASRFKVDEVSADMAYSSNDNLEAIDAIGATPLIPFKSNATAMTTATVQCGRRCSTTSTSSAKNS